MAQETDKAMIENSGLFDARLDDEKPQFAVSDVAFSLDAAPRKLEIKDLDTTKSRKPEAWEKIFQDYVNRYGKSRKPEELVSPDEELPDEHPHVRSAREFFAELESQPFEFKVEQMLSLALKHSLDAVEEEKYGSSIREKRFILKQELDEFLELTELHNEEVRAGFYTLPYQKAKALERSENSNKICHEKIRERYTWLNDQHLTQEKIDAYSFALGNSASLSQPPWTKESFEKEAQTWREEELGDESRNKRELLKALHLNEEHNKSLAEAFQAAGYGAQWAAAAARNSAAQRESAHGDDAKWAKLDAEFRKRRTEIARKFMDLKIAASSKGDLNFAEQLEQSELEAVLLRMRAEGYYAKATQGLATLFGISTIALPQVSSDYVAVLSQLRDQFESFLRRDQSFVVPLSIRSLIGETAWEAGLNDGKWTVDVGGAGTSYLGNFKHVRTQGVSAFVSTNDNDADGFWTLVISPPSESVMKHLGGTEREVDQAHIPPAISARVQNRELRRQPDLVGMNIFQNTSPLGQWTIEISDGSHKGAMTGDVVRDVELDIHILMQQDYT